MRISSTQIFNIARQSMASVNQDMVKTQEQMSTGKRVLTPADDPVAATKIMQLEHQMSGIEQYKKNIDIVQNNLSLEESVLDSVGNVIQRLQELTVKAGNTATLSASEYDVIAQEIDSRLDELVNLMNSKNAGGDYIFGGYKSSEAPFDGSAVTGYRYRGDEGQQQVQIADGTFVAATDSGKKAFMNLNSAAHSVQTSASAGNKSQPPAQIDIGQVVDQAAFDDFYPEDIVITFNSESNLSPPSKNFTATERSTGRVISANQAFVAGAPIEIAGVSVRISGNPSSGVAAVPATRVFGAEGGMAFPADFSGAGAQTFTLTVGSRTETLTLNANITSAADLAGNLSSTTNGNAAKLARLGIGVSARGFEMPLGVNFKIANGSPAIDAVMGLNSSTGSVSTDGVKEVAGDRFLIESSDKQDLLTTVARFKNALQDFDGTDQGKTRIGDIVAATLKNLTNAQDGVQNVVTSIGARVNTLESTRDLHLDTELINKEIVSQLRDVDYAEAASRLSQQSLILQAAQQSFIRVSQLSLFNRL